MFRRKQPEIQHSALETYRTIFYLDPDYSSDLKQLPANRKGNALRIIVWCVVIALALVGLGTLLNLLMEYADSIF